MKVIIIAHAAIRAANRQVYRRLATRGHDVSLVVPDRWHSVLGGRLFAEPEPVGSPLKLHVRKRIGKDHVNLYFLMPGIGDLIPSGTHTAIYIDADPAGLIAAQGAFAAQRKAAGLVILSIQNIFKHYPPPFNFMQRYVFARAGACVAVTQECEDTIRLRGYRGPVSIVRFGYALEPLSAQDRQDVAKRYGFSRPSVGYVGRLVEQKGVDLLIRAMAKVPEAHVVIGGDGPARAELEALAERLEMGARVTFLGNLAPEESLRVIGALDICTLPSRTTSYWKDQQPRAPVEAMAQGVPIIGSSSGGIPETIGDAGLIFPEDDVDAFAACIAAAMNPSKHQELVRLGLARAHDEFSLDRACDVLQNALELAIEANVVRDSGRIPE